MSRIAKWLFPCIVTVSIILPVGFAVYRGISTLTRTEDPVSDPVASPASGSKLDASVELAIDKQKEIWAAEHTTFEIERRFGSAFLKALKARDRTRLGGFFRAEATLTKLADLPPKSVQQSVVVESRAVNTQQTSPIDVQGLADWLVDAALEVGSPSSSSMRVLHISREDKSKDVWSTTLLISLTGQQIDGERIVVETTQEVVFDIADESLLNSAASILEWHQTSSVRRSGSQPLFREATSTYELDKVDLPDNWNSPVEGLSQYRFQTAVADFNGDGLLDIACCSRSDWLLLTRTDVDGPFVDVAEKMGIAIQHRQRSRSATLATWIDFDNDGHSDLLMGNRLYRNLKGEEFVDVTVGSNLSFASQAMGAQVADYDCDGLLDLYVVFQKEPSTSSGQPKPWVNDDDGGVPNRLFRNLGNGRFLDVTIKTGAGGGNRNSLAACWFFFDGDRYPDLYIANDFGRNVLLRNLGDGRFEDLSESSGTADYATSMGAVAGDLNNDGTAELYVANMYSKMGRRIIAQVGDSDYPAGIFPQIQGSCAGNRLYQRHAGQNSYQELASDLAVNAVGWAYAPAMLDVDNDGWLDIYSTCGFLSFDRTKPDG